MTREAQIRQTADEWLGYYHPTCTQDMLVEAFRCGAEWADRNPKSPWISVEDRLPKEEDPDDKGYSVSVIGLFSDGSVSKCFCSLEEGIWFIEGLTCDPPTHWMPIPEL